MDGADALAWQLKAAGHTGWQREVHLIPGRKFRTDLAHLQARIAVEVDGGTWVAGRHNRGAGVSSDCEKACLIAIAGYRGMRVTTEQVKNGMALKWIEQALKRSLEAA